MLNYIWAGLIVSSFVFALWRDVDDLAGDSYRNGQPLPVVLSFPEGYDSAARRVPVEIRIEPGQYASFYRTEQRPAPSYPGYLVQTQEGIQLRFGAVHLTGDGSGKPAIYRQYFRSPDHPQPTVRFHAR